MMGKCKSAILILITIIFLLCSCGNELESAGEIVQSDSEVAVVNKDPVSNAAIYENDTSGAVDKDDLVGYWHAAPDFSEGFKAAYEFFYDGYGWVCDYISGNGMIFSGNCDVNGNMLKLELSEVHSSAYSPQLYTIEYMAVDEATGNPAIIIENQKFWKMNKPIDIINGCPLYINLDYNYGIKDYQSKNALKYGDFEREYGEHIIIHFDEDLHDFKICRINYEYDGDFSSFYVGDIVFSLDVLPKEYYVEYVTTTPEGLPYETIIFHDSAGAPHSYIISYNGRNGSTCAYIDEVIR